MKKMVFMAAFVAATAAFVACSSNDDLVQQKPDVPEEQIEEKVPMTIIVSDLASRGTDLDIDHLNAFTMYGLMTSQWTTGKLIEKSGTSWTTTGDLDWQDENTHTFYAINDVAHFSDLYDSEGNDGADTHADVPVFVNKTGSTTEKTMKFSYAIPTDYAEQVDLLVAKTSGSKTTGDPAGSLTVNFNHALAQIKAIKVYCNIDKVANTDDKVTYRFRINGIRLGGLKSVGIYTFGDTFADDSWTVSGSDEVFEIPLKTDALTFANMGFVPTKKTTNSDEYAVTLPLNTGDGGLYLIPQVAAGAIASVGSAYEVNNGYAELDAQVFAYSVPSLVGGGLYRVGEVLFNGFDWTEEESDAVGFGKIRVPLKFTLEPGNGYTLVLDISRAVIYENEGGNDPATCTGIKESIFSGATIITG